MDFILELKSIQYSKGLSQETPAYTAKLHVNGWHAYDVRNDGNGGCDVVLPNKEHADKGVSGWREELRQIDAWAAKNLPPLDMSRYEQEDMPQTLETWCHGQLYRFLDLKDIRRMLKKATYYDPNRCTLVTLNGTYTPDAHAWVQANHPEFIDVNNMTPEYIYEHYWSV